MTDSHESRRDGDSLDRRINYLFATHTNILSNYQMADQKAGVVILLNTGLIGGLYGLKLLILDAAQWFWLAGSLTTFGILTIATALAIAVVYPAGTSITRKASGGSFAIPSKISSGHSQEQFMEGFGQLNDHDLIRELCALVYSRGQTETRKYKLLRLSIAASAIGWLGSIVLVLVAAALGTP